MGNVQCLKSPMLLFSNKVQCRLLNKKINKWKVHFNGVVKQLQKIFKNKWIKNVLNLVKNVMMFFLNFNWQCHSIKSCFMSLVVSGIYIDISGNCQNSVLWHSVCAKAVKNSYDVWIWDFVCVVSVFMLHQCYMLLYTVLSITQHKMRRSCLTDWQPEINLLPDELRNIWTLCIHLCQFHVYLRSIISHLKYCMERYPALYTLSNQ